MGYTSEPDSPLGGAGGCWTEVSRALRGRNDTTSVPYSPGGSIPDEERPNFTPQNDVSFFRSERAMPMSVGVVFRHEKRGRDKIFFYQITFYPPA